MENKRWFINRELDWDDGSLCQIIVHTPLGTGPRAMGWSFLHVDLVENRRYLAMAIKDARKAAYLFKQRNKEQVL